MPTWERQAQLQPPGIHQFGSDPQRHAVLPGMVEQKWGRVVNITGKSEPEKLIAATPSKAAVHAWATDPWASACEQPGPTTQVSTVAWPAC